MPAEDIQYSDRYYDAVYEYRHVLLPADIAKLVPRTHLLSETEWRNLGIQQSPGWVNYMIHPPEPHVLLFRRYKTQSTLMSRNESMLAGGSSQQTITL